MKRLTILRHAKSSWDDPNLADFDRPLNDRGRKEARRIGGELNQRKTRFDLCVASTAARVRGTLDGFVEGYGEPDFEIRFEPKIYEATMSTLLHIVRGLPGSSSAPLIVGHNPGLHQLVLELADGDRSELRDRAESKFPTAALAAIEFDADNWTDVGSGSGLIVELIFPKELD
jgi:phosphohistidine phosphatase